VKKNIRFVQGNEACVEAALYAGLDFFAGYPITPSTEIAELLSYRLPKKGGKFIQMEDEIASMCAIIGASLTGNKVMTATSGPGFSLKQEAIGFAVMTETPCVIVNVQRGGPSSGLPTSVSQGDVMQARWGTHGEHAIITLTASNNLKRLKTSVKEGTDYHPYLPREDGRLPMSDFGHYHRYNVTGLMHDMWGFPSTNPEIVYELMHHLVDKIQGHTKEITMVKEFLVDDAEVLLVSYGSSARTALHVVENRRARGERFGLLELQTLWPFPVDAVRKRCDAANYVIVVEMNMGQILHEVKKVADNPNKVFLANQINGSFIAPSDILNIMRIIQGKGA